MTKEVVKEILELTDHLAKAQQALYELRKYGVNVKITFENDEFLTADLINARIEVN